MWLDMVNEPAKYCDDIVDFTEIDDKLAVSAARWRLNAEWLRKEDELKEAEDFKLNRVKELQKEAEDKQQRRREEEERRREEEQRNAEEASRQAQ
jgi:hypothetical protein